ncbi:hypothetical protein [Methanoregula sp.]|uniref:hypothetical protein n=2 Tax=Methanoregula sp. TaxID=2052170 RepID=UPI003BB175CC
MRNGGLHGFNKTFLKNSYVPNSTVRQLLFVGVSALLMSSLVFSVAVLGLQTSNAVVTEQLTSLQLPAGAQLYLYGYGTGGAHPSSDFLNGQYASVTDADGYEITSLAATRANSNSFTTGTSYQVIGGVAVSGFSSYTASYESNPNPAAPSVSDTFTVSQPGSLAVVVAVGGGEQTLTLSGLPNMVTDAASPNDRISLSLSIAHATLDPGTYTVSEQTVQSAAGQDPNHAGDIIGVWVFQPASSSTSQTINPKIFVLPAQTQSNLIFTETGLPQGSVWGIDLIGNDYGNINQNMIKTATVANPETSQASTLSGMNSISFDVQNSQQYNVWLIGDYQPSSYNNINNNGIFLPPSLSSQSATELPGELKTNNGQMIIQINFSPLQDVSYLSSSGSKTGTYIDVFTNTLNFICSFVTGHACS